MRSDKDHDDVVVYRSTIVYGLLCVLCLIWLPARAQSVRYFTRQEVLAQLFSTSEKVVFEKKILSASQIANLKKKLASQNVAAEWTIHIARTGGKIDGYAIIDAVKGKEEPITFVVCIHPDGSVREVEILQYRESYGGQVKNKSFRRQFVGKTTSSPLKIGQDIQHVSGATISSKSLAWGVRRALAVWKIIYQNDK